MRSVTPIRFAKHVARYKLRGAVQHLVVHVTGHCNLRCEHCFVDFTPRRDLELDDYRRLARDVGPFFWLDVGGGEPFLRRDLAEIVTAFDADVVHIPTNGSLLERTVETTKRIRGGCEADLGIALSLDGLRETHDRLRQRPGSWDEVWRAFDALREVEGISVYVNTVLMSENREEILELADEVWRRRPDFHAIALLRGGPVDPRTTLPSTDELRALGPELLRRIERYDTGGKPILGRMARNYHRYLWNVSLRTIDERRQVVPCLAGSSHLVVWADGAVASCETLPAVGNLREQGWNEILAGDAMRAQLASIRGKECYCTHNCALFDSIMYRPASLPQLLHQPL